MEEETSPQNNATEGLKEGVGDCGRFDEAGDIIINKTTKYPRVVVKWFMKKINKKKVKPSKKIKESVDVVLIRGGGASSMKEVEEVGEGSTALEALSHPPLASQPATVRTDFHKAKLEEDGDCRSDKGCTEETNRKSGEWKKDGGALMEDSGALKEDGKPLKEGVNPVQSQLPFHPSSIRAIDDISEVQEIINKMDSFKLSTAPITGTAHGFGVSTLYVITNEY